jgi:membrane peptidoglycan carboxypeptidase
VSSIANGGLYVEPRAVQAVYRNGVRYQATPRVVRRTVSADTAAALTTIMEGVVIDGTAKRARIDGYTVAGKTGTAQKLIDGEYSHSDHYASFVGFVPSRNPALAVVIVIDAAKGPNGDHGGTVAAPIFKTIAEPALRYLGIPSTINPPPPVLVARHDPAGGIPTSSAVRDEPLISLVADGPPGTVPDVRGMSAREAVRKLVTLGLNAYASGDGVVVSQSLEPGEPFESETVCRLVLQRTHQPPVTAGRP